MAKSTPTFEPDLPWAEHREDRLFRVLAIVMLLTFLGAGVALNLVTLPEVVQKNLVDVSPRLAKLILEKQKLEPPPKKELIKQEVEKKEVKKKEKPKKKKEKEVKKESAREVAKKSGLIALSDELEDLREAFDLDETLGLAQQTDGSQEVKIAAASGDLLTSGAQQSSGGIQTDTLNRDLKTSELAQRQTTSVESKIDASEKLAKASSTQKSEQQNQSLAGKRSPDEIERVFQKNKGGIFNIYNRALRKNPTLSGQVVVELTIAPSGEVTRVRILSSELGDEALERKLVLKIKRFKFRQAKVAEITVTYPIEFLPS
jgi:TonB family protein